MTTKATKDATRVMDCWETASSMGFRTTARLSMAEKSRRRRVPLRTFITLVILRIRNARTNPTDPPPPPPMAPRRVGTMVTTSTKASGVYRYLLRLGEQYHPQKKPYAKKMAKCTSSMSSHMGVE